MLLSGLLPLLLAAVAVVPIRTCRICQGSGLARPGCFSTVDYPCPACDGRRSISLAKHGWIEFRVKFWLTSSSRDEVFTY
jgi:hypothetical protein